MGCTISTICERGRWVIKGLHRLKKIIEKVNVRYKYLLPHINDLLNESLSIREYIFLGQHSKPGIIIYEFLPIYFGLTNTPTALLDLMNRASIMFLGRFLTVFIDNVTS